LFGIVPEVSSTYDKDGYTLQGSFLTDGNKEHTGAKRGYWHSTQDSADGPQWAKIVFLDRSTVAQVRVTNRCDGCAERLTGAKVFIGQLDDSNAEIQCGGDMPATAACTDAILACGAGMEGDYVIIRHESQLNIVEIEAYKRKPHSVCGLDEYESAAGSINTDRVCTHATVCGLDEYESAAATLTTDRVCIPTTSTTTTIPSTSSTITTIPTTSTTTTTTKYGTNVACVDAFVSLGLGSPEVRVSRSSFSDKILNSQILLVLTLATREALPCM
jgi:hypothetical protein